MENRYELWDNSLINASNSSFFESAYGTRLKPMFFFLSIFLEAVFDSKEKGLQQVNENLMPSSKPHVRLKSNIIGFWEAT